MTQIKILHGTLQANVSELTGQLKAEKERAAALAAEHAAGQAALQRLTREAQQHEADMDVRRAQQEVRGQRAVQSV